MDEDDWSPDADIRPGRGGVLPDAAEDQEPEGVKQRRIQEQAFLAEEDDNLRRERVQTLVAEAEVMSPATREWMEFGKQLEPAVMQLLRRRPPELDQILKWLVSIGAYKDTARKELKLRLVNPQIELVFPYLATQSDGNTLVYLLPSAASGIKMELGTIVLAEHGGAEVKAMFIGCFELPGFPFKFLLLGLPANPE